MLFAQLTGEGEVEGEGELGPVELVDGEGLEEEGEGEVEVEGEGEGEGAGDPVEITVEQSGPSKPSSQLHEPREGEEDRDSWKERTIRVHLSLITAIIDARELAGSSIVARVATFAGVDIARLEKRANLNHSIL